MTIVKTTSKAVKTTAKAQKPAAVRKPRATNKEQAAQEKKPAPKTVATMLRKDLEEAQQRLTAADAYAGKLQKRIAELQQEVQQLKDQNLQATQAAEEIAKARDAAFDALQEAKASLLSSSASVKLQEAAQACGNELWEAEREKPAGTVQEGAGPGDENHRHPGQPDRNP